MIDALRPSRQYTDLYRLARGGDVEGGAPMYDVLINSPDHWSNKAEEARAIGAEFRSAEGRRLMIVVAEAYDALARVAECELLRQRPRELRRGDNGLR